jgi:GNAT superfamily N-acetyltransferase
VAKTGRRGLTPFCDRLQSAAVNATLPIRPLSPADFAACRALTLDRDWGPEDAVWRFLLSAVDGYGIDHPLGGLAGCVMVARYGDDVAAVGMMLVAARWEGKGLGRRLMQHVLAHARDRVVVLYATGLGRPLYERIGFQAVDEVTRHMGTYAPGADPLPAVRPATADDLPDMVRLDAKAFGADRSDLLARLSGSAVVAADGSGHAFARDEGDRLVIGPLAADDEQTACALVDALARNATVPVRVDIPPRFTALSAWLRDRGLSPTITLPLMVYGGELRGDRTIPYAIASLSLG